MEASSVTHKPKSLSRRRLLTLAARGAGVAAISQLLPIDTLPHVSVYGSRVALDKASLPRVDRAPLSESDTKRISDITNQVFNNTFEEKNGMVIKPEVTTNYHEGNIEPRIKWVGLSTGPHKEFDFSFTDHYERGTQQPAYSTIETVIYAETQKQLPELKAYDIDQGERSAATAVDKLKGRASTFFNLPPETSWNTTVHPADFSEPESYMTIQTQWKLRDHIADLTVSADGPGNIKIKLTPIISP